MTPNVMKILNLFFIVCIRKMRATHSGKPKLKGRILVLNGVIHRDDKHALKAATSAVICTVSHIRYTYNICPVKMDRVSLAIVTHLKFLNTIMGTRAD
jgi:hypothetical protein